MSLKNFKFNQAAVLADEKNWDGVRELASKIVKKANRATSAKVGITYNVHDDEILIGARGAAAYPVELGTAKLPAKRYFKRTIDSMRE